MKTEKKIPRRMVVKKKPAYICLPFKNGTLAETARRITSVSKKTEV